MLLPRHALRQDAGCAGRGAPGSIATGAPTEAPVNSARYGHGCVAQGDERHQARREVVRTPAVFWRRARSAARVAARVGPSTVRRCTVTAGLPSIAVPGCALPRAAPPPLPPPAPDPGPTPVPQPPAP